MKINHTLSLLTAAALAIFSTPGRAQTTPAGAATSTTYPLGAVVSDSVPGGRSPAGQQRSRRNRSRQNATRENGTSGNTQDAQYRQSSSANGTAINNSNTTNYNTNNAITSPTGAGSNNATWSDAPAESARKGKATVNSNAPKTGTAAAIGAARSSKEPAITAGSTVRNASIAVFMASSPNYVTLQNALQTVDLDEALGGNDVYTIFAPSNEAFKKLSTTIKGGLLEGRNHDALRELLSYHVVAGSVSSADLMQRIKTGNGQAQLQTLAGKTLTARLGTNGRIVIMDETGKTAEIDSPDNQQANGYVHGINAVLLPKGATSRFQ